MNKFFEIIEEKCDKNNFEKDIEIKKGIFNKIVSEAVIKGTNIIDYKNYIESGNTILQALKSIIPKDFNEYFNFMKDRFDKTIVEFITNNIMALNYVVKAHEKDDKYNLISTLAFVNSYLTKTSYDGIPYEIPQYMFMRIAIQLYHDEGINAVIKCYETINTGAYLPASPTIFNSCFKNANLASCFLIHIDDDLHSILHSGVGDVGMISKCKGGIGLDLSCIRHSEIGYDGMSSGIMPILKLYDSVVGYVDQTGKRRGAATVFLRPHHIDIIEFIECVLKSGDHHLRTLSLNNSIWFPWFFWKRVEEDKHWSIFCPAKTPKLNDIWGIEFMEQYELYEKDKNIPRKTIQARGLLRYICHVQINSGMPYIMNGDSCNFKSNQKNLGYIKQSNLCQEIVQYTDDKEIAVCNLSQLSLKHNVIQQYIIEENEDNDTIQRKFRECYNFEKLGETTRILVENLNKTIKSTYYPVERARVSNEKHRPMGIGVSGFADMVHRLNLAFTDPQVKILNKMIFACIYYNAIEKSAELVKKYGIYSSFENSPFNCGLFQFDLWREEAQLLKKHGMLDEKIRSLDFKVIEPKDWGSNKSWEDLRYKPLANSLLIACQPTASTSRVLDNAETTEAHQSNLYERKFNNSTVLVVNEYLLKDLSELGLWDQDMIDLLKISRGSISKLSKFIETFPNKYPNFERSNENMKKLKRIEEKFKTMWELSQKIFIQMSADRGIYICQSQSLNIYIEDPSIDQLVAVHRTTANLGLKTGMYYLRQRPTTDAIMYGISDEIKDFAKLFSENKEKLEVKETLEEKPKVCRRNINGDTECISCQ